MFGLAWLTLAYGKSEIIAPIITAIIGGAGGFGWGKSVGAKKQD